MLHAGVFSVEKGIRPTLERLDSITDEPHFSKARMMREVNSAQLTALRAKRHGPTKRKPGRPPKKRRRTKAEISAKVRAIEADDAVLEAERRVEALAQTVRSRAGAMPAGDLRVLVSDELARARELHQLASERLM